MQNAEKQNRASQSPLERLEMVTKIETSSFASLISGASRFGAMTCSSDNSSSQYSVSSASLRQSPILEMNSALLRARSASL